jgi:two-component sensor histidine kinase
MWTVASIVPSPRLFWLQNVGTLLPTLVSTVFLCGMLRRHRVALATAERERQNREESLRDTNRLLELEIQEHRKTEDALRFAMRELDHRVKNTLATVQSVAEQTIRSARSLPDFSEAFGGRIQAMARIHTALAGRKWDGLTMAELIELVVGPYRHHAESIALDCDATFVDAELVRVLGMTLHELATNAAKYGALSTKEGRVDISCHVESNGRPPQLRIAWNEHHGPTVTEPSRRGFGIRLIEEALAYEAEGTVRIRFPKDGLSCEIHVPMERAAG